MSRYSFLLILIPFVAVSCYSKDDKAEKVINTNMSIITNIAENDNITDSALIENSVNIENIKEITITTSDTRLLDALKPFSYSSRIQQNITEQDLSKIEEILKQGYEINAGIDSGGFQVQPFTPLMLAADYAIPELVSLFIKYGADPNLSKYGLTPLVFSSRHVFGDGIGNPTECVKLLIEAGASVNYKLSLDKHRENETPIELVIRINGYSDIIKCLIEAGAPFKKKDLGFGLIELVKEMLNDLKEINAGSGYNNMEKIMDVLLESGAD